LGVQQASDSFSLRMGRQSCRGGIQRWNPFAAAAVVGFRQQLQVQGWEWAVNTFARLLLEEQQNVIFHEVRPCSHVANILDTWCYTVMPSSSSSASLSTSDKVIIVVGSVLAFPPTHINHLIDSLIPACWRNLQSSVIHHHAPSSSVIHQLDHLHSIYDSESSKMTFLDSPQSAMTCS